jgi:hypothetical protein
MPVSALLAFVLATVGNPIHSTTTGELAVPVASQPVGATLRTIQEALAHIAGVRVLAAASLAAVPPETQALWDKTPLKFGSDLECCVLVRADGAVTTLRMCPTERVREAYAAFSRNKDNPEAPKYVRFQLLHKLRVNPQVWRAPSPTRTPGYVAPPRANATFSPAPQWARRCCSAHAAVRCKPITIYYKKFSSVPGSGFRVPGSGFRVPGSGSG